MYGREALEFTFRFFAPYDKLILGIENSGSFHLITDSVNALLRNDYKDHFTAGAIMQVYMHWIHTHKKESPEEIARICYPMIAGHHY